MPPIPSAITPPGSTTSRRTNVKLRCITAAEPRSGSEEDQPRHAAAISVTWSLEEQSDHRARPRRAD
jgi:hypothetical protein